MSQSFMKEKPVLPLVLSMSLPMVFSMLVNALYNIVDSFYVAKISEKALTAVSLIFPLQNLVSALAIGFWIGISVVISISLGAGKKERVLSIFMTVLGLSGIVMVIGTIICQCIPEALIGIYSSGRVTIQDGSTALKIISTGFIISTVSCTVTGALEGLGKGIPSLLISFLRNIGIMIPCAFLLSCMIGVNGVWMSFPVTECICAVVSVYCCRRYIQENEFWDDSCKNKQKKKRKLKIRLQ